jgi:hypothetical protein
MTKDLEKIRCPQKENKENNINMEKEFEQMDIAKTWISGQNCCTLIVSRKLAERYGLTEPSHVVLEATKRGILIRKLEV